MKKYMIAGLLLIGIVGCTERKEFVDLCIATPEKSFHHHIIKISWWDGNSIFYDGDCIPCSQAKTADEKFVCFGE